nr:DUF5631 domain-containing protein [Mycobacterium shinjukuense]
MIDQAGSGHVLPGGRRPGPTLAEAVRRRDGLPRIAHAVAVAATRNYGVPDNEADLLHHKATQIRQCWPPPGSPPNAADVQWSAQTRPLQ